MDLLDNESLTEKRKKYFLSTAFLYHKEPIHIVRASKNHVFDEKGREYLDAFGGIVCISAGHNHPKVKEVIKKMLDDDEVQHVSLIYLNRHAVELAEALADKAPDGMEKVSLTNSGSEANELAFLMARQATGEGTIVSLQHAYHGGTSGVLSQCGHSTWRFRSQPTGDSVQTVAPYCYRCPFQKEPDSCALECAKEVERTIQTCTHGKIAAFIAEPVMGVGGFITPPDDYFQLVTDIVHNYGGAYISDEVQTGVGRCGKEFFLTKELGIDADFITMAKGMGNGAAIGGLVTKEKYSEAIRGKLYFNTFGGDPYQTAQAKVTMDIIEEEKLIENSAAMGKRLKDGLKTLMNRHELIGDVRGRGLLLGIELVRDRRSKEYASEETAMLMDLCKDKGVLFGKGGLFGNVLRIAPPLSIGEKEVDTMLDALDRSLVEVKI